VKTFQVTLLKSLMAGGMRCIWAVLGLLDILLISVPLPNTECA